MIENIKYRIGRYITGRLTYQFSNFKPNSAGSYSMRNQATEYNIKNLVKGLSKVSTYFNSPEIILSQDLDIDNDYAKLIAETFNKYGSDKSSIHNYEIVYAYILNKLSKNIEMLEIGLGSNNTKIISNMGKDGSPGSSLKAFSELLPDSNIYGADIDKDILFSSQNIECFFIDQTKYESYIELENKINKKLDLIIDDGLHTQSTNLNSLFFALNNLNLNGYLLIEDIPEYAIETWLIVFNIIKDNFECEIVKTKHFYVFILKKIS